MVKKLLLFAVLILLAFHAYSCTIVPRTFCNSIQINQDYVVLTGKITSMSANGVDLEVIEVLRGEETRTTVRVWDGTDFDCNGPWDMSTNSLGQLSDTIIISLPKISVVENTWDVIGDYRRPDPYSFTSELQVRNGVAYGLIKGEFTAPDEFNVLSFDYANFVDVIMTNNECRDIISGVEDLEGFENITFANPITSTLEIQNVNASTLQDIKVYSISGQLIKHQKIDQASDIKVDLHQSPNGLYVFEIVMRSGQRKTFKLIKK